MSANPHLLGYSTLELRQQRNRYRKALSRWRGSHTGQRFLVKRIATLTNEIRHRCALEASQARLLQKLESSSQHGGTP